MQRPYLTAGTALVFTQRSWARRSEVRRHADACRTGGERHDQIEESLFKLWRKVWSCPLPPLGSALLPQSLQGQLPCENGEGLCVPKKVVWLLTSRRCVTELIHSAN